jgi:hypothetical protein
MQLRNAVPVEGTNVPFNLLYPLSFVTRRDGQRDAAFKPICTSLLDTFCILAGPAKRFPVITARSTDSPRKMCCFF